MLRHRRLYRLFEPGQPVRDRARFGERGAETSRVDDKQHAAGSLLRDSDPLLPCLDGLVQMPVP